MDANLTAAIVGGIVGLITSTLPVFYKIVQDRKSAPQSSIDKGLEASEKAIELVNQYRAELASVREEVQQVRAEIAKYQDWARRLCDQVVRLGGRPVPFEDPLLPARRGGMGLGG